MRLSKNHIKRTLCYLMVLIFSMTCLPNIGHAEGIFRRLFSKNTTPANELMVIKYKGDNRSYKIHLPKHLKGKIEETPQKVPLVIVLHGGGGNAQSAEDMTGFSAKADAEGFIVVYPNGSGRRDNKRQTWNVKHCCGYAMKNSTDDIGFIDALINHLIQNGLADPRKIFVTGMSNGGMMTHKIGIELSHKIAGIAPVVSGLFGDEIMPNNFVSTLIINGNLDQSIPMKGGLSGGRFKRSWDGTPLKPAQYQGQFWAKTNNCTPATVTQSTLPNVLISDYTCPENANVIHYIIQDNGHAWPSGNKGSRLGDTPSKAINATDVIWDFFKRQSLSTSSQQGRHE